MKIKKLFLLTALAFSLVSCSDLFEPAQENNRGLDEIYNEPTYAQGLLGYGYAMLPYNTKSVTDVATDDAVSNDLSNGYLKMATGAWAANNDPMSQWTNRRACIQYLNIFLEQADKVNWAKDEKARKMYCDSRKGEAYALRALNMYFLLMNDVPAKYKAIGVQTAGEYNRVFGAIMRGRISGRIAEAICSQASLLAASPAFAAGTTVNYAKAADDAAKVLDRIGGVSGISPTGNKWFAQTSEIDNLGSGAVPQEILWRGSRTNGDEDWNLGLNQEADNFPPSLYGKGRINPTQNLVDAFPTVTGYPIADSRGGYDAGKPYENRDPRLDMYVIHDGSKYKGKEIKTDITTTGNDDGLNKVSNSTRTGYYMKKLLREDCDPNPNSKNAKYHYPVYIRYTELFLNYAEAANEAWGPKGSGSHGYSAYDVIKAIRDRAGITDVAYLNECASDKGKMRELIRNERRLELCFENKRFADLRRWKAPIDVAAGGVQIKKDGGTTTYKAFKVEDRNYKEYMYYGPIPQTEIQKWTNLRQNKGWELNNK